MLRTGDAAPDFLLADQHGNDVRLSGINPGPIILTFFQGLQTPASNLHARQLRAASAAVTAAGAQLAAVSLAKPEDHDRFASLHELELPFFSDPEGRIHDLFDAWRTTAFGRVPWAVRRCTYVIDGNGIIRERFARVHLVQHGRQLIRALDRMKAQDEWGT